MSKPVINFRNRKIYKITPKTPIGGSKNPFIIQWIGPDRIIDFNNKDDIVGQKTIVKTFLISDAKNPELPVSNAYLNTAISLNNIREVEETDLKIGDTYHVGERVLILRGFINHEFYVSEDRCTNNYEIYYNVPVDEKKQIFRVPITYL